MIILSLIQNIALLVALAAAYQVIESRIEKKNVAHQILSGLLFGGVGLVGMMTPLNFAPGIIFDGRSIILSVSGLFGGPLVAAVAATMCGLYRLWLGGTGAWMGVAVILESAAFGVAFYYLRRSPGYQLSARSLWIFGFLVHVVMLALVLALPGGATTEVFRQIGLPILVVYPFATVLICQIFLDYERQIQDRKALKEREEFLSVIVENIPDMICVKDAEEFRFVRFNKAGEDLLGYSREEMIGKDDYDLFPKEDADFFRATDREILESGVPTEIREETVQTKHKGDRILRTKKIPLYGDQGIMQYVLSISEDITGHKRSQAELRESEARFKRFIDLSPLPVCLGNEDGVLSYFNNRFVEMFGYSHEDVPTLKEWWPLAYPDPIYRRWVVDTWEKAVQKAAEKNTTIESIEYNVTCKNGEIRIVEISCVTLEEGFLATFVDVTERRRSEDEIRKSESRLQEAQHIAHVGSWELDLVTHDLSWSDEIYRIFEIAPSEFGATYEAFLNLIHPEDREAVDEAYADSVANKTPFEIIHRLKFGDARIKYVHERCETIYDESGKPIRSVGTAQDITALKKVEEALRERERMWATLINNLPGLVYRCANDRYWTMEYMSTGCREVTGYSVDDFIRNKNLSFSEIIVPSYREFAWEEIQQALVKKSIFDVEYPIVAKGGETRWVWERGQGVFAADGRILFLEGFISDITVRRQIEKALQESEARFRQVADSADEWIWETDENGLYTYCSSAVGRILGYSPDELVGKKRFYDLFEPNVRQALKETAFSGFQRKELFRKFRNPNIRKDGEIVILETSGMPMLDNQGKLLGYRGTVMDITEREQAAESRELLAAVVEHASEAIVVTDTEGSIRYVNPAFERIGGYARDEVIGSNPRILKSGKHDDSFYRNLWQTITTGKVWRENFINKKKDGSLFEEAATISSIRNAEGNIVNYVAIKRDVTKEAQLEKQLMQSQKMEAIGTLAGGIAHDFNNMIFAITGYTELAMEELPKDSEAREDLERVLDASQRAGEMVKQILTFSRQGEPEKRLLDLSPIVKEGIKFLRASIPSTIEIRQHIEASLEKVHADPTQIHQVLMNLCTNAAHSMRDTKGKLSVGLRGVTLDADFSAQRLQVTPGKYIKLTVSDTGHGIPPDIIQRIFEPYFTTKEVSEGTGLGLAMIHGIVKSHNGAITVYSEPGQGTTFNVFFPVIEAAAVEEDRRSVEISPSGHERVLLVDDEEILIEMGQVILGRLGYQVVATTSPVEAVELFRSDPQRFDIIITDLTMPKMTGVELAAEITALRPGVPIILCTGLAGKITEEEAGQSGIQAMIKKPVSKNDLAKTVRTVLDRKD